MTHKHLKNLLFNTGVVLRKLRLSKDVRQSDITKETEITASGYCYMEAGSRDMKLSEISVLAEYYGLKTYELVQMIETGDIKV